MKFKKLLILSISLTLVFIWGHSMMSRTASGNESDSVRAFLEMIFGTESAFAKFLSRYVRKIAHFVEFAVLASQVTLYTYLYSKRNIKHLVYCVCFGPVVAAIDESIQIFSHRGSSIYDVMLDSAGYIFGFLCCYAICAAVSFSKKERKKKNV